MGLKAEILAKKQEYGLQTGIWVVGEGVDVDEVEEEEEKKKKKRELEPHM